MIKGLILVSKKLEEVVNAKKYDAIEKKVIEEIFDVFVKYIEENYIQLKLDRIDAVECVAESFIEYLEEKQLLFSDLENIKLVLDLIWNNIDYYLMDEIIEEINEQIEGFETEVNGTIEDDFAKLDIALENVKGNKETKVIMDLVKDLINQNYAELIEEENEAIDCFAEDFIEACKKNKFFKYNMQEIKTVLKILEEELREYNFIDYFISDIRDYIEDNVGTFAFVVVI